MSKYKIVIPVRYDSSRFPGKAMADIHGKPMIQHVYESALKTKASEIVIATDNSTIGKAAEEIGASLCMTKSSHESGTDRITEVVDEMGWSDDTIIVNLQGDEPLMPAELIDQVATGLVINAEADCATLYTSITNLQDLVDPNSVKVVTDINGMALYFSRAVIPCQRDANETINVKVYKRHIGLYAYRAATLNRYKNFKQCDIESIEKLEQLRMMYNGMRIHVSEATVLPGPGVDTPEDLEKVKDLISESSSESEI